jgi:hypothetical protein
MDMSGLIVEGNIAGRKRGKLSRLKDISSSDCEQSVHRCQHPSTAMLVIVH